MQGPWFVLRAPLKIAPQRGWPCSGLLLFSGWHSPDDAVEACRIGPVEPQVCNIADDEPSCHLAKSGPWMRRTLRHPASACHLVAVDVPPCLDRREGELVGRETDDLAVLVVAARGPFGLEAAAAVDDIGKLGCGSEFGTGEFAQWVEVKVVDERVKPVGYLVKSISISIVPYSELSAKSYQQQGSCPDTQDSGLHDERHDGFNRKERLGGGIGTYMAKRSGLNSF